MAKKFKAVIQDSELLKDSINAVSNLLNEGVFRVTKNGMELTSMDSANVAMVDMKILSSAFSEFTVEEDVGIGVNIVEFTNILKRAKATDTITLELEDNTLHISFAGGFNRAFKVPLLDLKHEAKTPNLEFPVDVQIRSVILEDGISDAELISDAVTLEADPDNFIMRTEGDSRKAELKLEKGNDALVGLNAKDHVKSTFPLDYLRKMSKAAKLADSVTIKLGNDYPMRMDFTVVDKVQLGFVLAPRIESE
ncbi:MAG: proliferating cell nuclear antigen (pcna) [Candidatus Undinarchaeales archaeon]|jgi:proliferating cell nuclear antigen|nr:proliferating cell nuclear antigen (pcna) [Candidatus Undinarchaeales archaeon]